MSNPAATNEARIAQLQQAIQKSPNDPLNYFSLGRMQIDADQPQEAVRSLQRALALDSKLSRAYQLLARAQLSLERKDEAVSTLKEGVLIAGQRGDLLPKNDMLAMLSDLGIDMPKADAPPTEVGEGQVLDSRTGLPGPRLPRVPFKGALGQLVYDNVSATSWREWIGMGTKVINELRLPLSDPQAQKVFDQHMIDFLNLSALIEKQGIKR